MLPMDMLKEDKEDEEDATSFVKNQHRPFT